MDMRHFNSDGVDIAYMDQGEGAPVLLIHGFASNVRINWGSPGWISALTDAGYRIIAFDNRGHGQSAKLYDEAAYGAPLMAEDARLLLDHLHIERAHVMGYSMGSRISTFLAVNHPSRVQSLILGGVGSNLVQGLKVRGAVADALEAPSADDVANPAARSFRVFAEETGSDLKALAACMRSPGQKITPEMLAALAMPVLVAVGTEDTIAGEAGALVALIPGAELLDIPRRDHMKAVGDRVYKNGVLAFLARHAAA